jgi:serine/threonine protein kinase
LIDAKKTANNFYLFFEYFNGGDLRKLLEAKGNQLSE